MVEWGDCDEAGIVCYPNYFYWLDCTFQRWLRSVGLSQREREIVALVAQVCRARNVTVLLVAHDVNPLLPAVDRVLYLARGHATIGTTDEVITSSTLTRLYGSPVEVVQALGRVFVVGAET